MGDIDVITQDDLIKEDIKKIFASKIPLKEMEDSTILITGVTGLIASTLVKTILYYNQINPKKINVVGLARNKKKYHKIFREWLPNANFDCVFQDIMSPINFLEKVDYIVHCASLTSSLDFVKNPVETIRTTLNGTTNVMEFAKSKKVKSVVYVSSLEVYGILNKTEKIRENEYGFIDPLSIRSSYSESKRMAECLCISYGSEYDIPVKIARLTQTFGVGVDYNDTRVFAEFARSVIEEKDVVLHTKGKTVRNYCYSTDAVSALISILIKGKNGEAYNVANSDIIVSILELAEKMLSYSTKKLQVHFHLEDDLMLRGYNPEIKVILDTTKLEKLGWEPAFSMGDMLDRLILSMRIK